MKRLGEYRAQKEWPCQRWVAGPPCGKRATTRVIYASPTMPPSVGHYCDEHTAELREKLALAGPGPEAHFEAIA